MPKKEFLAYISLLILPCLIFSENINTIVENNNIILSDYTTTNDLLSKTITNNQI
jgi:hypothetical protein